MRQYIFVIGGVLSGLGKGIVTASIGKILQSKGFKVTAIKIDPYVNYDAGTLRPTEHGEVWVTDDGGEIDQDLGHYERFLDINLTKHHNITTGKVFYRVIKKERKGKYLGKTVQIIPHVIDEIKYLIRRVGKKDNADFVLVEIGGTVGDYENIPFLEAARQMKLEGDKCLYVLVVYLPIPKNIGEMKTKPAQHAAKALREIGIIPDFIICRCEGPLDDVRKEKIALFCNVDKDSVIEDPNLEVIYELPLIFEKQGLGNKILKKFGLESRKSDLKDWKLEINKIKNLRKIVKVAIVGKYFDIGKYNLADSYISVIEAIKFAAWKNNVKPIINFIDSKKFEKYEGFLKKLREYNGIIVPGGFGSSGIEGKIKAIEFARKNKIPFLGLCFGLQLAVIEFARNVCELKNAHTTEINPNTPHPVISILPKQKKILEKSKYGASMRLGSYPAVLKPNTLVWKLYSKKEVIYERHRHRYEVNPKYHKVLQKCGLVFSGISPDGELVEFIELSDHPFFVATQAHPEFTSRFMKPNPLFYGFIKACLGESFY